MLMKAKKTEKTPKQWLKKFYPKEARDTSKKEALDHSLRKWRGLRVLREYSLYKQNNNVITVKGDHTLIIVDGITCALCCHHSNCSSCPLPAVHDNTPCDKMALGELVSPYRAFTQASSDTEPMIKLLETAKRKQNNERWNWERSLKQNNKQKLKQQK